MHSRHRPMSIFLVRDLGLGGCKLTDAMRQIAIAVQCMTLPFLLLLIGCGGQVTSGSSSQSGTSSGGVSGFSIMDNLGNSIGSNCPPSSTGCQLDKAVTSWMTTNDIPAAELAVRDNGRLVISRAYTMLGRGYDTVMTTNVFRLASVSKMLETAAYSHLETAGKLTGHEAVFPYLGITAPLLASQVPDPRINDITVSELLSHTSGLPGEGLGDPLFAMRDIEVQLGAEPLTEHQFAEYLYGVELNGAPGTTYKYSNVGYFLLAMVIEKATNREYLEYVKKTLLGPLGMHNWTLSPTSQHLANPDEIAADDTLTGQSVFDILPSSPLRPFNFEGGNTIWELAKGPTDMATTAESVSKFIHTWNAFGVGRRQYDNARDGCLPGVATWAESLNAEVDYALLFNSQPCLAFSSTVIQQIHTILDNSADPCLTSGRVQNREGGTLPLRKQAVGGCPD
jgi:CubicO group peptidase (beta-lactamase class C family)